MRGNHGYLMMNYTLDSQEIDHAQVGSMDQGLNLEQNWGFRLSVCDEGVGVDLHIVCIDTTLFHLTSPCFHLLIIDNSGPSTLKLHYLVNQTNRVSFKCMFGSCFTNGTNQTNVFILEIHPSRVLFYLVKPRIRDSMVSIFMRFGALQLHPP